jgi:hypothetical protein
MKRLLFNALAATVLLIGAHVARPTELLACNGEPPPSELHACAMITNSAYLFMFSWCQGQGFFGYEMTGSWCSYSNCVLDGGGLYGSCYSL